MTKDRIKFYIDNYDAILDELNNIQPEESDFENIEKSNIIDQLYYVFQKYCKDILDKYSIDKEALKLLLSFNEKSARDELLGIDEGNQLLRDIIDIYGDNAYDVLGCDSDSFEMSHIDGILSGENNQKYRDFYAKVLQQKCSKATSLAELSNILLTTLPEFISPDIVTNFLNLEPNRQITFNELLDFIKNAPSIAVDGNVIKQLFQNTNHIHINDAVEGFLKKIPHELFDQEFCMELLAKTEKYSIGKLLNLIPAETKSSEIYELAISKQKRISYNLPEKNIFKNMTDEEYSKWCETQILSTIDETTDISYFLVLLNDKHKTEKICRICAEKSSGDMEMILRHIPEDKRTREIFEILFKKSLKIMKEIPFENFDTTLTQEEYDKWVEQMLIDQIKDRNLDVRSMEVIPRERITSKVFSTLVDTCTKNEELKKPSTEIIPIYNRTIDLYENFPEYFLSGEIYNIPCIDVDVDKIEDNKTREEYKRWQAKFSDEEKENYRKRYETLILKSAQEHSINIERLPREGWTLDMWKSCLDSFYDMSYTLKKIPVPENKREVELFKKLTLYAISKLPQIIDGTTDKYSYQYIDLLSPIPRECLSENVILEAVKKDARYLDYADLDREEFEQLLEIGYKAKLETLGRTNLSTKEIQLMKKFAKNNSSLFSTLNLSILKPEIIDCIGENSLEAIVRYRYAQSWIIELAKDIDALTVFGFALENLKEDSKFIAPLIEKLSMSIVEEEKIINSRHMVIREAGDFLKSASNRIKDKTRELSEEEKTIISYLSLNPQEASKIKNYEDILHYVENKNSELDEIISNPQSTLIAIKNAYLQRVTGIDYETALDLVNKYGNDPEELLAKYQEKNLESYNEKAEKEALEIVIKLKSLINTTDLMKVKQAYYEAISKEDKSCSFTRLKKTHLLDNCLRRAYGKDIVHSLNDTDRENNIESLERTEDGQEYIVRKLTGPFNRMVSLMNAYRKSDAEGDMYDRWNTNEMSENHALCYSFIDETNPGTALINFKSGIIISIKDFDEESVSAMAPYDLCSYFKNIGTYTGRQQKFYMTKNLPNQTRGRYSEVDIEIQDVLEGVTEYKKIQPTSIICFEEVDEESIKAAIELSKKLGRTVPIELIDRRELAHQTRQEIDSLLEDFKNGENLQPELVGQIITKFNNVRNAHMYSKLANELLGEKNGFENPDALFNKIHLNNMISECIEIAKQRIEHGEIQEGLITIEQIKQFIKEEREKNVLMPTMAEKQILAGIDLDLDYRIDEIQRTYIERTPPKDTKIKSLEIFQEIAPLNSVTFDIIYGKNDQLPTQLTLQDIHEKLEFPRLKVAIDDVHRKGYYSKNKEYDEEHISRVIMFSDIIASLERAEEDTRTLLIEASKYYSCGRQLDIEESHEQYSAKIAEQELQGKYSQEHINIILATIELQNFRPNEYRTREQERKDKLIGLCQKYGLSQNDALKVEQMARYIADAVELDKTRFVEKAKYNSPEKRFFYGNLQTESAKKMVGICYGLQDELSRQRLKLMKKIVTINFQDENVIKSIMEDYFTKIEFFQERTTMPSEITESPIVQEIYFRDKFKEIKEPEKLAEQLSTQDMESPILQDWLKSVQEISSSRNARDVIKTSQEVKTGYIEMEYANQNRETTKDQI